MGCGEELRWEAGVTLDGRQGLPPMEGRGDLRWEAGVTSDGMRG